MGEGPTAILCMLGLTLVAAFFMFLLIFTGWLLGTLFLYLYLAAYAGFVSFGLNLAVSSDTPLEESYVGAIGGIVSSLVIHATLRANAIFIYESSLVLNPESKVFLLIAIVVFYLTTGPAILLDTLVNGRYRIACQALLLLSSLVAFPVLHYVFRIWGLFDSRPLYSGIAGFFFISGAFVAIFLFLYGSYRWDIWRA
jgi:hypothetical protein